MSIDMKIDNREIVIHKFEIERLKRLGFNKYYFTSEFVQKYKENEGEPDENLKKILNKIEKQIEQKEEITDEEDNSEEEDNRKQEEKVDRLLKIAKERNIEVTERELSRLVSYEFNEKEIFSEGFIRKFQEIKNELESYIVEELGKFFDKRKKRIENNEKIELKSNTSKNKETEIVIDNKDEDENNLEKPINTDDFRLSEESDSENLNTRPEDINSDNESDTSEETNNMAATLIEMRRLFEQVSGLPNGALDNALTPGEDIAAKIDNTRNELGGIINMPIFSGKEDEDVGDWIRQFEVAFIASRKNDDGNGIRKAAIVITCLRGSAVQWYNRMKEAAAGNLVNWVNNDNNNDFKHRINRDFTRPDVRRRKMIKLRKIRQNNESVEDYTRRFRNILRIATRGQPLPNNYQVDFYIEGLEPTIGYNVRRQNPGNLNDAVNQARREEEAKNELIRKTTGIDIGLLDREKRMEEILREETRKYKEPNPVTEKIQKEVTKDDMDDLLRKFEKMEAHLMKRNNNNGRNNNQRSYPPRNNKRDQFDYNQLTCYTCGKRGHALTVCRINQRNRGNNRNQINYMDEEYYDNEYNVYNMEYGNDNYEENKYINNEYMNDEYIDDECNMYEMNYEEKQEEYNMYPAPPRRSERNKDKVINEERNRRTQMQ
jgi:hypothetical protein